VAEKQEISNKRKEPITISNPDLPPPSNTNTNDMLPTVSREALFRLLTECYRRDQAFDLGSVRLSSEDLLDGRFSGLDLRRPLAPGYRFSSPSSRSRLERVSFSEGLLDRADFQRCILTRSLFRETSCRMAHFDFAVMEAAIFLYADLQSATLDFAAASYSDFRAVKGMFLSAAGASLRYCDFRRADLQGADLRGADLTWADFTSANLSGANFSGATIERAVFTNANLDGTGLVRRFKLYGEYDKKLFFVVWQPTEEQQQRRQPPCPQEVINDPYNAALKVPPPDLDFPTRGYPDMTDVAEDERRYTEEELAEAREQYEEWIRQRGQDYPDDEEEALHQAEGISQEEAARLREPFQLPEGDPFLPDFPDDE